MVSAVMGLIVLQGGVERPLNDDRGALIEAGAANFNRAAVKFHNHFDER